MKYLVYYENNEGTSRCLYDDDHFETLIDRPEFSTFHCYEAFKGYEASDEGLIKFKADFLRWNAELKSNDILPIDWLTYYSNFHAVELTFKRLCKGKYEHFDPIDATESRWIESTHNGGLTYCTPGKHHSHGFDFSSFYPTIMGQYKFIMPHKKGTEHSLVEMPKDISLGYYRVKITSAHPHAKKLFAFCKTHTYTNISLLHALELQEEYDFNIELIVDDKPNAYIYPKGIKSSSVFGVWLDKLFKIKLQHPKNKLIKHLLSSLHGSLSRSNNLIRTYEQIQTEGLQVSTKDNADYKIIDYIKNDYKEYYKLQSMLNPYRYSFRLKSFLTAYGRVKIAEVAQQDVESVVRIQTDGIVFNKKIQLDFPFLGAEDKTTGYIEWHNCNSYTCLSS